MENVILENLTCDKMGLYIGGSQDVSYEYYVRNCRIIGDGVVGTTHLRCYQMSNLTIEDCHIENTTVSAIQCTDMQDVRIRNNVIRGVSGTFSDAIGEVTTPCQRFVVEGNRIEHVHAHGIKIYTRDHKILNNTLIDVAERTVDPGIFVGSGINLLIQGNTIRHARLGISMAVSAVNCRVIGNTVEDIYAGGTAPYGISISGTGHVVKGNLTKDTTGYGILVGGDENMVTENTVLDAGQQGIRVTTGQENIVCNNSIKNSTGVGLLVDNTQNDSIFSFNHTHGDGITPGTGAGNDFTGNK
jgi:parallel beta-helix repeat protein